MKKRIIAVMLLVFMLSGCVDRNVLTGDNGNDISDGGSINIYSYQYDTLNPIFTDNNANLNMLKLIFEPLVSYGADLKTQPMIADSWDVSSDGLMWTVHVRSDVYFHDGVPLDAEDVVESLSAARMEDSSYSYALKNVWKITQEDNYVHIRLTEADSGFINNLCVPVVKADSAYTKENFAPVGTGVYVFDKEAGRSISLKANGKWWGKDKPHINEIKVQLLPDKNTSTFSFDAGYIDLVNTDVATAGKYASNAGCNIIYYDNMNLTMLGLNNARAIFGKKETRQAISCAINRQELCEKTVYSKCVPANSMINPMWYFFDDKANAEEYSIKDAKFLLNSVGYNNDNPLKFDILVCNENKTRESIAEYISQALAEIGVNATVTKTDWNTYLSRISSKDFDAFVGEVSFFGDADMSFLMSSSAISNGKNYFSCSSGKINSALEDVKTAMTEAEIKTAYSKLQTAYYEEMPFVSLFFGKDALIVSKKIRGDINPTQENIYNGINTWHLEKN